MLKARRIRKFVGFVKYFDSPHVRTIVGVNSLVIAEVGLLREAFLAVATNVLLISGVISDMV